MIQNKPKVALLTSVYGKDNPEWFEISLKSIFEQTYGEENINIYLGVDGDIPESIKNIISKYNYKIFKIYYSKENIGLTKMKVEIFP